MSALLNTQGIAEILGVKRRHVTAYITKRPDFPPPCINVSQRIFTQTRLMYDIICDIVSSLHRN